MSASWHFNVDAKGPIDLQARFEGTHSEIKPGENFRNLTYEQLKRAGAGTIRVNADGSLTMTSDNLGLSTSARRHSIARSSRGFTAWWSCLARGMYLE